jgi:hypothetical protein
VQHYHDKAKASIVLLNGFGQVAQSNKAPGQGFAALVQDLAAARNIGDKLEDRRQRREGTPKHKHQQPARKATEMRKTGSHANQEKSLDHGNHAK